MHCKFLAEVKSKSSILKEGEGESGGEKDLELDGMLGRKEKDRKDRSLEKTSYFHFFMLGCETNFTFTSCDLNVNFVQLDAALDQDRMVANMLFVQERIIGLQLCLVGCLSRGKTKVQP